MSISADPRLVRHLLIMCFLFLIVLFVGAAVFHALEDYDYLDSFYFATSTITTVGYGDIYPITTGGKVFTIFYSTFGVILFFYIMTLVAIMGVDMEKVSPR